VFLHFYVLFIPPYGSMVGILSFTVPLFVCLFVCAVMDFSVAEKDSGVKHGMLVRLLSGMSFSHLGELWPRGSSPKSLNTRQVRAPYDGICVLLTHLCF